MRAAFHARPRWLRNLDHANVFALTAAFWCLLLGAGFAMFAWWGS